MGLKHVNEEIQRSNDICNKRLFKILILDIDNFPFYSMMYPAVCIENKNGLSTSLAMCENREDDFCAF